MGKQAIRVWLALLAIFMLVLVFRPPMVGGETKSVSVSEFIARIETGDVAQVTISGSEVRGALTAPGPKTYIVTYADAAKVEIIRKLTEKKIPFEEERPSVWMALVMSLLPWVFLILIMLFVFRSMASAGGRMQQTIGASKSKVHRPGQGKKVTFEDVAGCEEAKEEVKELVDFLKDPSKFGKLGGRIPKGVLLMGPPGTGKTLLARAVAGEANVPFIEGSASEFVEMFVGVGASRVRDLFEQGRKNAPCIIFIDELDAVGKQRGGIRSIGGHDEREQTLNQILTEMDGFTSNDGVIVIGATNQPEVLDDALLRAGRFDRQVVVARPDLKGREAILKVHARKLKMAPEVDFKEVARGCAGMTGADLESLINEAALHAGKLGKENVGMEDIWYARDKVTMGPERKSAVMSEDEKNTVAVHEAGHTLIGWFTAGQDPVHKVTIIPRGRALGLTQSLPLEDKNLQSKEYLHGLIRMLLGGRAAEYLVFGKDKITTGASNDLERASELVDRMVCELGMSELGLMTYRKRESTFLASRGGGSLECSPEMAAKIDAEKSRIINDEWKSVLDLMKEKMDLLKAVSGALLAQETLDEGELFKLLGPPAALKA